MQSSDPRIVVITGSTRGIGYGLAEAFLQRGCSVVVSGRDPEKVAEAAGGLSAGHPAGQVLGQACDVNDFSQVEGLWAAAQSHYGRVDIWINNAGIANPVQDFWKLSPEEVAAVVNTNLTGAMYGSMVALRGLLAQGSGALYNMEGMGSDGKRRVKGLSVYGTTKAALHYFNQALVDEVEGTPVLVGMIRPGMVMTELITRQYEHNPAEWEKQKGILTLLSERVETVAPFLVDRVLANRANGALIRWNVGGRMLKRMLLAPFRRRASADA